MQEVLHFFFIKLADYSFHHPFSLQAASGHQLAQLPSMCSHWGYLVTSWLPQYIFFNFYFASFLLEFGVLSEARGHICLEAVLPWFVWPTFPCSPVCLTDWLLCTFPVGPLSLSLSWCSTASVFFLLCMLPLDRHAWAHLSPASWCFPDLYLQPRPISLSSYIC